MAAKFKTVTVTTTPVKLLSEEEIGGYQSVLILPTSQSIRVRFDGIKPSTGTGITVAANGSYVLMGKNYMLNLWACSTTGTAEVGVNLQ